MIRATGGSAFGATSTRSRFLSYAMRRASSEALIPSCAPSSPISRTRGTRMSSFVRVRSCLTELQGSKLRAQFLQAQNRLLAAVAPDGEVRIRLLVAVDDHVWDLLDLGVADPLPDRLVGG